MDVPSNRFDTPFLKSLEKLFNAVETDFKVMKSFSDHIIGGELDLRNFWAVSGTHEPLTPESERNDLLNVTHLPVVDVSPPARKKTKGLETEASLHGSWGIGKKIQRKLFGKATGIVNDDFLPQKPDPQDEERFTFDENFVLKQPQLGYLKGDRSESPAKHHPKKSIWQKEWLQKPSSLFVSDSANKNDTEKYIEPQITRNSQKRTSIKESFKRHSYGNLSSFLGGRNKAKDSPALSQSIFLPQLNTLNVKICPSTSPIEGYAHGGDFSIIPVRSNESVALESNTGDSVSGTTNGRHLSIFNQSQRILSLKKRVKPRLSSGKRKSTRFRRNSFLL